MTLTPNRRTVLGFVLGAFLFAWASPVALSADDKFIIVQSTTSTQNSGLLDHILPMFQKKTGIEVRVVAVGTGQALKNAMNGDGDVVLVHSKPDEEKFVAEGWGVKRHDVMYNDYVMVGPASDRAKIASLKDAVEDFKHIGKEAAPFASRGDDSGTHKAELKLWEDAGVDPKTASGKWYLETGSGMGATLNTAVGKQAYALTDRGTWLSFANKGDFKILVEGDPKLFNQYGVTLVNPAKHPNVKAQEAQAFVDWLVSSEGQAAIASYKIDGQQLFFPNAGPQS
jgi:tungstate transport system substrate-binding protein